MILPCTPVSLAVDFILSSRRLVSKKWPAHKVKFSRSLCLINQSLICFWRSLHSSEQNTNSNSNSGHIIKANPLMWYMWQGFVDIWYWPTWFVANCSSIPSSDNWYGQAIIPALFLQRNMFQNSDYHGDEFRSRTAVLNSEYLEPFRGDHTYMRMFRCLCDELKDCAKLRTELRELRSISMTCSLELGTWSARLSFTFWPLSSVLAGMITFAPLRARTLAVSFPIPFVAPGFNKGKQRGERSVTDRPCLSIVRLMEMWNPQLRKLKQIQYCKLKNERVI
jgi:hypothetical protein